MWPSDHFFPIIDTVWIQTRYEQLETFIDQS